jgi:hypothetical protein
MAGAVVVLCFFSLAAALGGFEAHMFWHLRFSALNKCLMFIELHHVAPH